MLKYVLIFSLCIAFFACSNDKKDETSNQETNKTGDPLEELLKLDDSEMLVATIKTNKGTMELELFSGEAPKTVRNFCGLAQKNYYDGVTFHRVIDGFMIQGGDPTGTGSGGESIYGAKFEDEFSMNLKHDSPGVLSMANAGPNTNGSQFFITLVPTPWLNGKHSVFGKIINGMDVLQTIGKVPTSKPLDKPIKDVVMEDVTVEKRKK
ncbi:MAG: peptidylprolyl isomerase [Ignavibacteria bacterium]|jgi:cyclophilin family peptidyl-prolyl cis-trans isomerase